MVSLYEGTMAGVGNPQEMLGDFAMSARYQTKTFRGVLLNTPGP